MSTTNTTEKMTPCNHCDGTGGTDRRCVVCHGRGEVRALCDGCGERRASRDGLCDVCDADVDAHYAAARFYFGDAEGELRMKGYRC